MDMKNKELGHQGEEIVEDYLIKKGYLILENNYLKRVGEIDLIVFDPKKEELVFVEVKTRRTSTFGYPEEAVTLKKLGKIEKTALNWLKENGKLDHPWRIDIVALELEKGEKITHFENVTI